MYTLIAENQYGQQVELTHNDAYSIKSVLGLDPPDGIINTTRNAVMDGSVYNSSYMDNRTITITLAINYPAEINRINLYKYFKIKFPVTLRYKNGSRDVWIQGYTQSFQIAYFDKKETAQIVILCPRPYFNDAETAVEDLSNIVNLFEFPFEIEEDNPIPMSDITVGAEKSIINYGDVDIGMIITITALGSVTDPEIYNTQTNEFMKLSDTMAAGDVIEICTIPGKKSIKKISEGTVTSLIGKLVEGSTWLVLRPGDNVMAAYALTNPEYMQVGFTAVYQYEGV